MLIVTKDYIGVTFLRSVIGSKNSCHPLYQSDLKPKATTTFIVTRVFSRFEQYACLYFYPHCFNCREILPSSDWLPLLDVFDFTTLS